MNLSNLDDKIKVLEREKQKIEEKEKKSVELFIEKKIQNRKQME